MGGKVRSISLTVFALMGGALSCSLLVDPDRAQCDVDADCLSRGSAFTGAVCREARCVTAAPADAASPIVDSGSGETVADSGVRDRWSCLGNVTWTPPSPTETVVRHEQFLGYSDSQPIGGIPVYACSGYDVACLLPIPQNTDGGTAVLTDAEGKVAVTVTKGFTGFLYADPSVARPGSMPLLVYTLPPPSEAESTALQPIPVTSLALFQTLAGLVTPKVTILPERGHLTLEVRDCNGEPASGVQLEVTETDDAARRFYLEGAGPSVRTETDSSGRVIFANLTESSTRLVTVKVAATGKVVGSRTMLVRAGAITTSIFPPTP